MLYRSVEAELAVAGVKLGVKTWNWSDHFSLGPRFYGSDRLFLNMSSTRSEGLLRVGADRTLGPPAQFGTLSFWPAGTYILQRASGGETRGVTCVFNGTWLRELAGISSDLSHVPIQACLDLKNRQLCDSMSRLASEVLTPGLAAGTLIEGLSLDVTVELARHLRSLDTRSGTTRHTLTPWQMKRVTRYIETFSGYIPDIDELAALCGISNSHFRRLFKETTDQTPHDYARNAWAEKAKALLSDPNLSLREVWSQFGFSSPSSFAIAFRRATGQAPTAYRRQHQRVARPGLQ